jgi:hAT family C-terminal dimerisation region
LSPSTSFSLWDAHDRLSLAAQTETSDTAQGLAYERQLDTYLLEPRLPRSTDIFGYWHCSQYPSLEPAAQKYLSAPPTSVASEQLFSSAGQLYADRRSNLLGENAEKLLFLAYNVRLLNFNY